MARASFLLSKQNRNIETDYVKLLYIAVPQFRNDVCAADPLKGESSNK